MSLIGERFTEEEQKLLLNILINHEYAIELLSSEINDIETGIKTLTEYLQKTCNAIRPISIWKLMGHPIIDTPQRVSFLLKGNFSTNTDKVYIIAI